MRNIFTDSTAGSIVGLVLLVILAVALIIVGPLAIIWALNTLFPVLTIPYTIWTYLAVCVLNLTVFYKPVIRKNS